ncbi:GNAT family N-acetyltransferase [Pararhizobium antarcticum]|uniref:Acetyltransferase n=1 Tax=Pararhizobium antarcticum TaxID=1798805 RepID=A0A657LLP2_9HYPH|nr:GNAT family N-acetyltransferase [Pararhizobium antarcticum]OJF90033.1 acetyltransferase [Pararhizobium antarcticum]OJF93135.1 acetyltransferase [Rhizobium sp. 58]
MAALVLRPATRADAAELAILVDIASHGFAGWLWSGAVAAGVCDTALERGRATMREDAAPGAWPDATVADWNGEITGVAIGYRLEDSVRAIAAPHPVIAPLLAMQRQVVGSRFIDSLAVYRQHRGKGIGQALLADQIASACGEQVSLITESHNEAALGLYSAHGFIERARLAAVPLFEDSKRHDWVLMTLNRPEERGRKHNG